jgi:hypothetical protein
VALHYGVTNLAGGGAMMVIAGLMSGLLGIGSGSLKVIAMDYLMHIPLKVSSATSNFMIGVTAGAGALVGSRILPYADVKWLRIGCVIILAVIAIVMGWRALTRI